jgi:hypothetical protein
VDGQKLHARTSLLQCLRQVDKTFEDVMFNVAMFGDTMHMVWPSARRFLQLVE